MANATEKEINVDNMPFGMRHVRIVLVASLGQFIGQGLATLIGIVIPLMQLSMHPELSSALQGILGCISLIGIMLGSVVFGHLSDKFGYLFFFRLCPVLILATSLCAVFFNHVAVLLICLFIMGFAIGGEYSLDPDYISELMPEKWKVYMVGLAKALASAGSAFVALICIFIIRGNINPDHWSYLFYITAGIALLMLLTRIRFAQSPGWLMEHGETAKAEQAVKFFLGKNVIFPVPTENQNSKAETVKKMSFGKFFSQNIKQIILTGVPWACEGLGVYGIGIFLPVLIMAFHIDTLPADASQLEHISNSVEITFLLCLVMMVGFALGLLILHKYSHVKIQAYGFWLCSLGLILLLVSYLLHWSAWVAITGFIIFELFLNAGPHLITFILPSQIYPVHDRGTGSGIAAGIGKSGAVIGAFFIPMLLKWGGATLVLIVSIIVMILGGLVTRIMAQMIQRESVSDK